MSGLFYLRDIVQGNEYAYALTVLAITLILARAVLSILEGLVKLVHKHIRLEYKTLSVIETPVVLLIVLSGLELAVKSVLIINDLFTKSMLSIIIIILTYILIRASDILLGVWSIKMTKEKGQEFHSEILPLTRSVTTIVLIIVGVIIVLQLWGVEVGTFVTSLGIAGIVLGFALKDTLGNIFGGMSLIVDNSFKKGDLIQLESGEVGEVMEINLRSTKLKNFDSETIIVPNGQLANTKIINLAQPTPTVRVRIPVGVAYGSDPSFVRQVLHDAMGGHKDILKMPKRIVRFIGLGDYSLDFEVLFYISNYSEMYRIKDEVLEALYKSLTDNGVEIPFPIHTLIRSKQGQYDKKWTDVKTDDSPKKKVRKKKRKK